MSNKGQTLKGFDALKSIDKTKLKPNTAGQQAVEQPQLTKKMTQAEYDALLDNEPEANPPYNPNPFDFVFFADTGPKLYALDDLNKNYGQLQSGYLEVKLKALTPVHIVGKQEPVPNRTGEKIQKSSFYIQDGKPCIPGSSIRGMLRSFIEAVTNGWVSQANSEYGRLEGRNTVRHIEFASWGLEGNGHNHGCISGQNHKPSPAIPLKFKPSLAGDVDIATYLFGYVDEGAKSARAGRVIIEDAYFGNELLKNYKMVDIDGEAIMGGPRPRANWWYMRPKEVWDRSVQSGARYVYVAHIVGDEFWGRKFYYHQDPEKCIEFYTNYKEWWPELDMSSFSEDQFQQPYTIANLCSAIKSKGIQMNNGDTLDTLNALLLSGSLYNDMQSINQLPHQDRLEKLKKTYDRSVQARRPKNIVRGNLIKLNRCLIELAFPDQCPKATYWYDMSCLDKGKETSFRIYFDRVPERLIQLFCTCLCLPGNMRYKLGYGKAFGYGSVEFSISQAMLRTEKPEDFPDSLSSIPPNNLIKTWTDPEINEFIDKPSLNKLAQILTWDVNNTIIFTYPPYNNTNFKKVIQKHEFCTSTLPLANPKNTVTENQAVEVAKALWNIKKPVHFQLYQARAKGYSSIKGRKP